MAPTPLQYEPSSFTQAAKDVSHAAWEISRIAVTLKRHNQAVTTGVIQFGLTLALEGCAKELYTVHAETERVAGRVKTAAGVIFFNDHQLGQQLNDGGDYDTRHNGHPYPLFTPYGSPGSPGFGQPWITPYGKLPGE